MGVYLSSASLIWSVSTKTFGLSLWWPRPTTYHSPGDDGDATGDDGDCDDDDV